MKRRNKIPLQQILGSFALLVLLGSCAQPGAQREQAAAPERAGSARAYASAPNERPGLGTKWGETRHSTSGTTSFVRARPHDPLAVAEIFYNDRAGVEAMAAASELRRTWPVLSGPVANLISIGLQDESGKFLPGLSAGGRWFVVGEAGRRYSIVVRNRSDDRLEIVLSVDGLDVLDGRAASLDKRGYVVPPQRTLIVDGFRQSTESVAAFRFGSMNESYAHEKYHNSNNVGVIGVAVFNERGTFPWTDHEVNKRLHARPFPSAFATPP